MKHSSDNDSLAYSHLNLMCNPFGEIDREQRKTLVIADTSAARSFLAEKKRVIQILGPVGCGKTSFMLALLNYFPESKYQRTSEGYDISFAPNTPLFLDEFDLLSFHQRRKLRKLHANVVICTHHDFSREFKKSDYAVMTVEPRKNISITKLEKIVSLRVERARRSRGPVPVIDKALLHKLLVSHNYNIRSIENALYDMIQNMKEVKHVQMRYSD